MNVEEWQDYLNKIAGKVNSYEECVELFEGIGETVFQYKVTDKPEYSFYQEYKGMKMKNTVGFVENPVVTHIMKLQVIQDVFNGKVNPIKATAAGKYAIKGSMAKLLKASGFIAYVKKAHSEIME
ncbi:MAG: SCP2 sterol-binding domain-containing protein [Candidatus Hodarchaeota archaeon]